VSHNNSHLEENQSPIKSRKPEIPALQQFKFEQEIGEQPDLGFSAVFQEEELKEMSGLPHLGDLSDAST